MLEKTYNPADIEQSLYARWEEDGCFRAGRVLDTEPEAEPYTIVIPPPNVTGHLHMGHALNNTLQDILCRFERMRGRDVLWQPGTDHAGIATQMVVERQLAEEGNITRREMGREAFIERVWQWKRESGANITNQLRRLGASCDWSRERFTMDEGLSQAVVKVFVSLYEKELIYKDKRLVNWDPGLLTAISDLEVEQRESNGHLWHFNYPLADGSGHITVATTRPETMLGDSGVAVHPEDTRYQALIGKHVILPIVGRRIPIVADSYADPEQGSGAVKITPAHDFNDFEVGKRCGLAAINMLDQRAAIDVSGDDFADMVGRDEWQGLDRFDARRKVVEVMEAQGLLVKTEEIAHVVPYGDRSGQVIEPWLTDQWYVNAAHLAKPAIEAVEQGQTRFVPENWQKTYFEWMRNIQPWCISRQLWWGHQIPAWYGEDGEIFVAEDEAAAHALAEAHYGKPVSLTRDEDVLDTWFSSALWSFSTLGWRGESKDVVKEQVPDLAQRYPTNVLVTGFDIIFFWVARMMMMGLHFMGEVPFREVYVHALVRDAKGAKMSKSKGNVIDPLELIDKYGADALRFTLAAMASPGRDIKLSEARVEGYRNFGTKLWNAARFCEMNGCFDADDFDPANAKHPLTQWLVAEVIYAYRDITRDLENYRFDEAANRVYQLVYDKFCDWYVELAKPILQGDDESAKAEVQAAAKWGLEHILRLLHPFMPFITEQLWQTTAHKNYLMLDKWEIPDEALINKDGYSSTEWLINLISEIRSIRAILNISAKTVVRLDVSGAGAEARFRIEFFKPEIDKLARVSLSIIHRIGVTDNKNLTELHANIRPEEIRNSIEFTLDSVIYTLILGDAIDFDKEYIRLEKDKSKQQQEVDKLTAKLDNKSFLAKAPEEVIEEIKSRLVEEDTRLNKIDTILKRLEVRVQMSEVM